jgi:SAM-dependent methyltransferase
MLKQIADRIAGVAKEEGLGSLLRKCVTGAKRLTRREGTSAFDNRTHLDTDGEVPLWRLKISSENAKFGCKYQASDPAFFLDALASVPAEFRDLTFIDLGCGKGRALVLASEYGFKKVIGVEFSSELAEIARRNLSTAGVAADVVEADACRYCLPQSDLLVYMYNPFGKPVMESVVRNLVKWGKTATNLAFVAYVNPIYREPFESAPEFQVILKNKNLCVWKFRNVSN